MCCELIPRSQPYQHYTIVKDSHERVRILTWNPSRAQQRRVVTNHADFTKNSYDEEHVKHATAS